MRRTLILLIILMLLPLHCLGESSVPRLTQLDIINQSDARLSDWSYNYHNKPFHMAGCLPASIANALVTVMGTPEIDTPALIKELLTALIPVPEHSSSVDASYLYYASRNPRKSAVQMRSMLATATAIREIDGKKVPREPQALLAAYAHDDSAHPLIMWEFYPHKNWQWMTELTAWLVANGHPDARIAITGVSVGDAPSPGPLRSGKNGHYLSFFLAAEEFYRDGTWYVLDSYPRAMEGETYGEGTPYPCYYAFVSEPEQPFSQYYSVTRLSDTLLQLTLKDDPLAALHRLSSPANETAYRALLQQYAEAVTTYGRGHFLLYLP